MANDLAVGSVVRGEMGKDLGLSGSFWDGTHVGCITDALDWWASLDNTDGPALDDNGAGTSNGGIEGLLVLELNKADSTRYNGATESAEDNTGRDKLTEFLEGVAEIF